MKIREFNEVDGAIHQVAQMMSLSARNLIPPKADSSHINLKWDDNGKVLLGRTFTINGGPPVHMLFNPISFEVSFASGTDKLLSSLKMNGKNFSDYVAWWESELLKMGIKKEFSKVLPDNFAPTQTIKKPVASLIDAWMSLRSQANDVFEALNNISGHECEIRIWPHHFDTGVYYVIKLESGEASHAIGAGLAIADKISAQPYYYMYGWRNEGEIDFSHAPQLSHGRWITEDWKGAIYPVFETGQMADKEEIIVFFETAYSYLSQHILVD